MIGIDLMLGQYIKKSLEEQLGKKMVSKVEQELYLWYKITLDEATKQFDKLDRVLINIYGKNPAKDLEKKFIKSIIHTNKKNNTIITITESQLVQTILTIIEDKSFRIIFQTMDEEKSFEEILESAFLNITKASAYRKLEYLIKNGLVMETGYTIGKGNRRVKTYKKTFDGIEITIYNNKLSIVMTVNSDAFQQSIILSTIFA